MDTRILSDSNEACRVEVEARRRPTREGGPGGEGRTLDKSKASAGPRHIACSHSPHFDGCVAWRDLRAFGLHGPEPKNAEQRVLNAVLFRSYCVLQLEV